MIFRQRLYYRMQHFIMKCLGQFRKPERDNGNTRNYEDDGYSITAVIMMI